MPIRYDNPREVGADRIVNAVAAYEKYHCELTTVDFVSTRRYRYYSARIKISAEALFHSASKLFRVELTPIA